MACAPEVDVIMSAVVGKEGLQPALKALRLGKTVALANKEAMVMAGGLLKAAAREGGGAMRPVDSEHSAIWQCLAGEETSSIRAAGHHGLRWRLARPDAGGAGGDHAGARAGPSRLEHGPQDHGRFRHACSTRASRSSRRTGCSTSRTSASTCCMHRESIIHSLVEMVDGSFKAQLSWPDMRQPIQYALSYPQRLDARHQTVDFAAMRLAELRGAGHGALPVSPNRSRSGCPRLLRTRLRWRQRTRRLSVPSLTERIGFLDIPERLSKRRWVSTRQATPPTSVEA